MTVSGHPKARRGPHHVVPAWTRDGEPVVLKWVFRADVDDQIRERVGRAAARAGEIRNSHLVFARLISMRWTADGLVTINEWIAGERRMDLVPGLRFEEVVTTGMRLCDALIHVRENGSSHGDVAARNVLIEPSGAARLIDYDFADTIGEIRKRGFGTSRPSDGQDLARLIAYLLHRKVLQRRRPPSDADEAERVQAIRLLGEITPVIEWAGADALDRISDILR